jgi:peptide/nickel transport system permease protein
LELGVKRKFSARNNKIQFIGLSLLLVIALFAQIIATDQPLYVQYKGKTWFPAFSSLIYPDRTDSVFDPKTGAKEILQFDITEWKELETESVVWAPIPWSPAKPDRFNRDYTGPFDEQMMKSDDGKIAPSSFRFRHHFGTDLLGNDLMSGIIHGCQTSLKIGLLSACIAGFFGIFLGALSGYYGNDGLRISLGEYLLGWLGLFLGLFWGFISRSNVLQEAFQTSFWLSVLQVFLSCCFPILGMIAFAFVGKIISRIFKLKQREVPLDDIIQRFTELFSAVPKILVILTLAAVFREKSVGLVIGIIGLSSWPTVCRFTRGEMLRIRSLNYIEAARSIGMSDFRIIFKHALPNAFTPIFTQLTFIVSSSILAESSLSFLGIGVPDDVVTWGSILSAGRQQFDAWWMVLFPGLAIFCSVMIFQALGNRIQKDSNS